MTVKVWDLPTRLFHWLVVVLVAAAYLTWRFNRMDWHAWTGEALLALVLWRLAWGIVGSDTARFRHFVAAPGKALRHLAHFVRREPDEQVGHNPAGGWMVLLLLALLLGQCLSGIYVDNDVADTGPLTAIVPASVADLITRLHDKLLWLALLAAIAVHLAAILAYRAFKRHQLVLPMITGRKRLPVGVRQPHVAGLSRALLVLACAAAAAAAIATFA
jgi:cytochrome b